MTRVENPRLGDRSRLRLKGQLSFGQAEGLCKNLGKPRYRKNYKEGDFFAVPLRTGGFAVGVVARKGTGSIIFGYFFGPRRENVPTLDEVQNLTPEQAVDALRFSYLGLVQEEWPIIGRAENWNSSDWPLPLFVRFSGGGPDEIVLVQYDEKKLAAAISTQTAPLSESVNYYRETVSGYGAVEIILTRHLNEGY